MWIKTNVWKNSCIRLPLEWKYDPCDGPEDIMGIDLLGELPNPNKCSYFLTTCAVLFYYLYAVPLRKPYTDSVDRALVQMFTKHAYVSKLIWTVEVTAFASIIKTEVMRASGIKNGHTSAKHE